MDSPSLVFALEDEPAQLTTKSPVKASNLRLKSNLTDKVKLKRMPIKEVRTRAIKPALAFFDYQEPIEDLSRNVSRSLSGSRKRLEQSQASTWRLQTTETAEFKIQIPKVMKA